MALALALAICSAATNYAQQPPQPVCNHQWVPSGGPPALGPNSNPACGQAATPPHQQFQVDATEFYNGFVDSYQGQSTKCTTDRVTLMPTGECGGTNTQGQPVTCLPQNPGFSSSSVSDSVTTTFEYQQWVETGSPGDITCVYSGHNAQENTSTLSASTANCGCGCPCPSSAPGPTFPPPPYTIGEDETIYSPPGWIYVPGTSTYNSTVEKVAAVYNPAAGEEDPTPTANITGCGTTNISGLNLVFTASGGSYVANGCSTGTATLNVTPGNPCRQTCGNACMDCMVCPAGGTPTCKDEDQGPVPVCQPGGSPIIVDPFGQGFHLTGTAGGVSFTFFPDKPAVQISWTDPKYSNGWLALDRNGNGRIDNATELFGNLTPQPPSATPNGYLALAMFDQLANGGNGNGVIDPGDQVFSKLLVWIDSNHDGISQPEELHSL